MLSPAEKTSSSTKSITRFEDEEFGTIICRRSPNARYVRVRVSEDGSVRASMPRRAPIYLVKELIDNSREDIRSLIQTQKDHRVLYVDGMTIGHSHHLKVEIDHDVDLKGNIKGQSITICISKDGDIQDEMVQSFISTYVKRALRREAVAYLPRRLQYLADQYGFSYKKERFAHQSGRWGSCSSGGTISLNVALMNLPHDLIDYVLIHELAHTKQMNHSTQFWNMVEDCLPDYKARRKLLKSMSPIC